jgi:hypothetical protein
MRLIARAACLSCFASILCLAEDWSGWLVSARCFTSMHGNRNDTDHSWDGNLAIRYCTPDKDTHSFAVVREDGSAFNFDSAANEKAAALPLSLGKHFVYFVKVAIGKVGHAVIVQRISLVARVPSNGHGAPGL